MKTRIKIVVTGSMGSGVTSLVKRYSDGKFTHYIPSTVGVDFIMKTFKNVIMQIWDQGGNPKFISSSTTFLNDTNVFLLTCDLTKKDELENLNQHFEKIKNSINEETVIAVVGTKKDADNVVISETELQQHATEIFGSNTIVMTTSAKTGENVDDLFKQVSDLAVERLAEKEEVILDSLDTSPKSKTPLVDKYDAISRWSLKFLPENGTSKDEISRRLAINDSDDEATKTAKIDILASLTAFKYYRQWSTKDLDQQEILLCGLKKSVEDKKNINLNLNLHDLMRYVKNDGFFIQRKIPGHLHESLEALLKDDKLKKKLNYCLNMLCSNKLKSSVPLLENEESLFTKIKNFFEENIGRLPSNLRILTQKKK